MEIFAIAFRNVFRNPRRTALNLVAVTLGIAVMVTAVGFIRGFTGSIYTSMVDLDTAQAQILHQDYLAQKRIMPLTLAVDQPEAVKQQLQGVKEVQALGARIDFPAEITNGITGVQVMARGIEPQAEAQLTLIQSSVFDGKPLDPQTPGLLVGMDLADKLKLKPGSRFFLNAVDKYRTRNQITGTVTGIFSTGYPLMDSNMVFLDLATASSTLALDGAATKIVVKFKPGVEVKDGVAALNRNLSGQLKAYPWTEFAQALVTTVDSRMKIFSVLGAVLALLIIIGIMNSMSMAVEERVREIGTIRALGVRRAWLRKLFLAEGAIIGLMGALAGSLVGFTAEMILGSYGFDVRSMLPKDLPIPFSTSLRPIFGPGDFILAAGAGVLVTVLGSLIPAVRASRLIIKDALGSHV